MTSKEHQARLAKLTTLDPTDTAASDVAAHISERAETPDPRPRLIELLGDLEYAINERDDDDAQETAAALMMEIDALAERAGADFLAAETGIADVDALLSALEVIRSDQPGFTGGDVAHHRAEASDILFRRTSSALAGLLIRAACGEGDQDDA